MSIPIDTVYTEPVDIDVPAREGPWQIRPYVSTVAEAKEAIALGADSLYWAGLEDAPSDLDVPVIDFGLPVCDTTTLHLDGVGELGEVAAVWRYAQMSTDVAREVRMPIGRDVFLNIAKFRAARVLWRELAGSPPFLHAVGSIRTLTRYDAHTNMLRQTTQAFAAAVGGADAITLLPFDSLIAGQSDVGRRQAITTQLVLRDEAELAEAGDAATGSYYVDWLTRELVERARNMSDEEFQEHLARRNPPIGPILGVSHFPVAGESHPPHASPFDAVDLRMRDAAAWEALRDNPAGTLFLCKLGTPKEHGKDAAFARNLFVAGGYTVVEGGPDEYDGSDIACVVGPGEVELPAKRVIRDLDPAMDRLAFLQELRK